MRLPAGVMISLPRTISSPPRELSEIGARADRFMAQRASSSRSSARSGPGQVKPDIHLSQLAGTSCTRPCAVQENADEALLPSLVWKLAPRAARRYPPRAAARAHRGGPADGRATQTDAPLAQSERARAGARRRRLLALGVARDHAVPGRQDARADAVPDRRARAR